MSLSLRLVLRADDLLRPFGLVLWFTVEGEPGHNLRVRGLRIARRTKFVL